MVERPANSHSSRANVRLTTSSPIIPTASLQAECRLRHLDHLFKRRSVNTHSNAGRQPAGRTRTTAVGFSCTAVLADRIEQHLAARDDPSRRTGKQPLAFECLDKSLRDHSTPFGRLQLAQPPESYRAAPSSLPRNVMRCPGVSDNHGSPSQRRDTGVGGFPLHHGMLWGWSPGTLLDTVCYRHGEPATVGTGGWLQLDAGAKYLPRQDGPCQHRQRR